MIMMFTTIRQRMVGYFFLMKNTTRSQSITCMAVWAAHFGNYIVRHFYEISASILHSSHALERPIKLSAEREMAVTTKQPNLKRATRQHSTRQNKEIVLLNCKKAFDMLTKYG